MVVAIIYLDVLLMSLDVDLYTYWRVEERYAKAGYRLENIEIGIQLEQLFPQIHRYDLLETKNGVYMLEFEGVTAFLVKTQDMIRIGTYQDHIDCGGKEVIHEFLRRRYPNQRGFD